MKRKIKYHRTKDKFFSGSCRGGRCWSCHAQGRKKDLYGDVFEYSVFGSPQQKIGNFVQTKLEVF